MLYLHPTNWFATCRFVRRCSVTRAVLYFDLPFASASGRTSMSARSGSTGARTSVLSRKRSAALAPTASARFPISPIESPPTYGPKSDAEYIRTEEPGEIDVAIDAVLLLQRTPFFS